MTCCRTQATSRPNARSWTTKVTPAPKRGRRLNGFNHFHKGAGVAQQAPR